MREREGGREGGRDERERRDKRVFFIPQLPV